MIRVSMEVREETALSRATVQAESIREAVSITKEYYPGREVRVIFPIAAEDFFNAVGTGAYCTPAPSNYPALSTHEGTGVKQAR